MVFFGYSVKTILADSAIDLINQAGNKTSFNNPNTNEVGSALPIIVGRFINVFLSLIGVIFIILIIFAGYNWMTAAGDKAKVDKSKILITQAVIGLVIVISAFAITFFVTSFFTTAESGLINQGVK